MLNLNKIVYVVLNLFVLTNSLNASTFYLKPPVNHIDSLVNQKLNYKTEGLNTLLDTNKEKLKSHGDSVSVFKNLAIINAELKKPEQAFKYTKKYIESSFDFSILNNDSFDNIQDSSEYKLLSDNYLVKIDFLSFLYLNIAFIGLFLVVVLNLKRHTDKLANVLISSFVLIHVLFVIEFVLYFSNVQFKYPHTYLFSSSLALMYGPLLYFYFKRVTQGYTLKKRDLLHFVPTILLLVFVLSPIYFLDRTEKMKIMLGINTTHKYNWLLIFIPKLMSLIIYGIFIGKLHYDKLKTLPKNESSKPDILWEKNIYRIHLVYVFSYLVYGLSISGILGESINLIYNSHVASMSVMITYIAYMAYAQPKLFHSEIFMLKSFQKYEKSGLTDSLSKELSENLFKLLIDDKIYKDCDISLDFLSNKLGTTRHNTSQIINEHFNMNFFELINKFRIDEAINMLKTNHYGSLHIIDIAYEVGFNNKVTFNKAFKKQTSQTPSEFIASNFNNLRVVNY